MSDNTIIDNPRPSERDNNLRLFYPNISHNRLMFHGTPYDEKKTKILAAGLLPPHATTVSSDTLARRMSFCDDMRYGGSGYIFAFRPEEDEVEGFNPQWGRTISISMMAGRIPQQRIIFYVDGKTARITTRRMFEESRDALQNFITPGYNPSVLETNMSSLITLAEQLLREQAIFIEHTPTQEEISTLSQEIVWSELCGAVTHLYDELLFVGSRLHKVLSGNPIKSIVQLTALMEKDLNKAGLFDAYKFLNQVHLIYRLPNLRGLGFEGFNYDEYGHLKSLQQKIMTLQDQESEAALKQREQETGEQNRRILNRIVDGLKALKKNNLIFYNF